MLQYILNKMEAIILANTPQMPQIWNFLTGFWISLCSQPRRELRQKTITRIAAVVHVLLKDECMSQEVVLATYLELAKLRIG